MKSTDQTKSFYDMRDALAQPGCVVCRMKTATVDKFLDSLLWEYVNDPEHRLDIRRSRGFCRDHAWQLARPGALLGVAIIMRDVMNSTLKPLADPLPQPPLLRPLQRVREALSAKKSLPAAPALLSLLDPRSTCPACEWADQMEEEYLSILTDHLLGEDGLLAAYERSDGLCLPHFRRALARARNEQVYRALVDVQRKIWQRLVDHLSEFIRKNDYRFRGEPWGGEGDAWLRAITALVGARPGREER